MLIRLLSLTEVGKKEIVRSVKAIRSITEAGSITAAKRLFDLVRDGTPVIVPLQTRYQDYHATELPVCFNLKEATCDKIQESDRPENMDEEFDRLLLALASLLKDACMAKRTIQNPSSIMGGPEGVLVGLHLSIEEAQQALQPFMDHLDFIRKVDR